MAHTNNETATFCLDIPNAFYGRGIVECNNVYMDSNEEVLSIRYRLERVDTQGVRGLLTVKNHSDGMMFGDTSPGMWVDIRVTLESKTHGVKGGPPTPRSDDACITSRRSFADFRVDGTCRDGVEIGFWCRYAPAIATPWTCVDNLVGFQAWAHVVLSLPHPISPHIFLKRNTISTPSWTEPGIRNTAIYLPRFEIFDADEESKAASRVSTDKLVIKARDGYMVIPCDDVLTDIYRTFHKDSPMHVLREKEMVKEARKVGGGVWDASADYDIATLVAFAWRYLVFETPCAVNINAPEHPDLMARTAALAGLLGYIPAMDA